jgi:hypothetical protein
MSRAMVDELHAMLRAGVTAEEAITACLEAIRQRFATVNDTPTGDYHERWAKALLDEQPIIVVSVLGSSSVATWVMDPHVDASLHASSRYMRLNTPEDVTLDIHLNYSLEQIREHASFLWREYERAAHLAEDSTPWIPPEQRQK